MYSTYGGDRIQTLRYGDSSCEEIEVFSPAAVPASSARSAESARSSEGDVMFVYIHGGYWQEG